MRLPKLIGITGKAGAGKDTLANYVVDRTAGRKYSFALPLKQALNAMFGWTMSNWDDREWKERVIPWLGKSPRQLAQTIGTEWGRELVHPELWVLLAEQRFIEHLDEYSAHSWSPPFVIPDVRFDNEAKMIKAHGGVVIEVRRPNVQAIAAHKSEAGVSQELLDIIMINGGTIDELCTGAMNLLRERA